MSRPAKPYSVLSAEKKSHRTKAELAIRKREEDAVLSHCAIVESEAVKNNINAHKHFERITSLLDGMQKNDAAYEQSINRYCLMLAEESAIKAKSEELWQEMEMLQDYKDDYDNFKEFYEAKMKLIDKSLSLDRQLEAKRKMLLAVEKENAMTIASALRAIPKTPEKSNSNQLLKALGGD